MRILILNIIIIFFSDILFAQIYEIKTWKYPFGPPFGWYNDSIIGDYNEDKDVILELEPTEHAICKIKIKARHLRFYMFKPYWIYEIDVLNVYWNYISFDLIQLKKMVFCASFYKQKLSINAIFIGTFAVDTNYLIIVKELNLDENIIYYVSQKLVITSENENHISKVIQKLKKE